MATKKECAEIFLHELSSGKTRKPGQSARVGSGMVHVAWIPRGPKEDACQDLGGARDSTLAIQLNNTVHTKCV